MLGLAAAGGARAAAGGWGSALSPGPALPGVFVSFGKHQGQALGVNLEWFQRSWICPAVLDAGVTGLQEEAAGRCLRGQRGAFRFAELYIATSRPHCLTSEYITFPFVWLTSQYDLLRLVQLIHPLKQTWLLAGGVGRFGSAQARGPGEALTRRSVAPR